MAYNPLAPGQVAELADAIDLGSIAERRVGSNPTLPTSKSP